MSAFGSSIAEKKRIILKNPDGSYSHCIYLFIKATNMEKEILLLKLKEFPIIILITITMT